MKIGIITILNVNNYGAELQASALNIKLRDLGYDNEIINYLYYKHKDYRPEKKSNPIVKIDILTNVKGIVLKWIDKYNKLTHPQNTKIRKERFDKFHKENTNISKPIRSISELYDNKKDYDVYIVGSDQVWNPNTRTSIEPYFLTFAPKDKKRISFASSFGVGSLNKDFYPTYKKCFESLDVISCRESSGVKLIKEITNREATQVVDPTLLLTKSEWESKMVKYKSEEPYILMYILTYSPYITNLALEIQKQTGYKIIRVCFNSVNKEKDASILNIVDAGPSEFLGLYAGASFVLTNSFHGSVFSLIFQKPFYTIAPATKNNNARQENLLRMVNLENRLIKENSPYPEGFLDIDFAYANKVLEEERQKSINFLVEAINS
ncbi:polysaccharide pyruvyl transferase family protein [Wenyingzhuangia sp. chi5]|uniref:Polysaccharide pyruvyl transferase family protein n=1 Tax=Wenyingzhuangia gilva TaxID=3057677 RepID=A0ABT8VNU6_9FLAO|nr:polysaccharide pyruvyl transferase family protein [Wenyingzhuangia sp. chi5]MDO3693627.1 polysaccharide pyruvyl transferase family protein [Wenyingzhuangia sp. chi5]